MRTTRIDVEGDAPGRYATITRRTGSRHIEVTILTPEQPNGRKVQINAGADKDELWAEAARLQKTLDGFCGCGGDINGYFNLLATFAD